jgi:hypothetical protein
MITTLIATVALCFSGMGCFALARPEHVVALFGTRALSIDGRNEVRAVYGGFGLAMAAILFATLREPPWVAGALLTVSLALFGMAGGRLVSRLIDGGAGRMPWLFFAIELVLASALLGAFKAHGA